MSKSKMPRMMRDALERYRTECGIWPAPLSEITDWVLENTDVTMSSLDRRRYMEHHLREALRSVKHRDEEGRDIRTYMAAPRRLKMLATEGGVATAVEKLVWYWDDIRTAPRLHVLEGFRAKHNQAKDDVSRLKDEIDAYNRFYKPKNAKPIQLSFDFN